MEASFDKILHTCPLRLIAFIMIPAVELQEIYIINDSWSLPTAFPSASLEYNFPNEEQKPNRTFMIENNSLTNTNSNIFETYLCL